MKNLCGQALQRCEAGYQSDIHQTGSAALREEHIRFAERCFATRIPRLREHRSGGMIWIKGVRGGGQNKSPALPLSDLLPPGAIGKVELLKQAYQSTRA